MFGLWNQWQVCWVSFHKLELTRWSSFREGYDRFANSFGPPLVTHPKMSMSKHTSTTHTPRLGVSYRVKMPSQAMPQIGLHLQIIIYSTVLTKLRRLFNRLHYICTNNISNVLVRKLFTIRFIILGYIEWFYSYWWFVWRKDLFQISLNNFVFSMYSQWKTDPEI